VQDILQKRLTNQWLDNIRKEFKVKIDEAKLNNIIKALNN